MINTDDLCDAQGVANLAGLRHPNSVHTYLRRYADMPRPVIDLGPGRPRLWLRPQIEAWLSTRASNGAAAAETSLTAGCPPAPMPTMPAGRTGPPVGPVVSAPVTSVPVTSVPLAPGAPPIRNQVAQ